MDADWCVPDLFIWKVFHANRRTDLDAYVICCGTISYHQTQVNVRVIVILLIPNPYRSTNFANPQAGKPATYLHTVLRDFKSSGQKSSSGTYTLTTTATGPVSWFVSPSLVNRLGINNEIKGTNDRCRMNRLQRPRLRTLHTRTVIPICCGSNRPTGSSLKMRAVSCRIRGADSTLPTFKRRPG